MFLGSVGDHPLVLLRDAVLFMMERNFRHLPIVDSRGTLLGILSLRGLLQHRTEELTHELDSLEAYFSNDSIGG